MNNRHYKFAAYSVFTAYFQTAILGFDKFLTDGQSKSRSFFKCSRNPEISIKYLIKIFRRNPDTLILYLKDRILFRLFY